MRSSCFSGSSKTLSLPGDAVTLLAPVLGLRPRHTKELLDLHENRVREVGVVLVHLEHICHELCGISISHLAPSVRVPEKLTSRTSSNVMLPAMAFASARSFSVTLSSLLLDVSFLFRVDTLPGHCESRCGVSGLKRNTDFSTVWSVTTANVSSFGGGVTCMASLALAHPTARVDSADAYPAVRAFL